MYNICLPLIKLFPVLYYNLDSENNDKLLQYLPN